jgi:chitodextrinase
VDFWELLNEQDADPKWTALMAEYVKTIDPYHHPITDWEQGAVPAIDFYSPHWYAREIEEGSDPITAENAAEWKKYGKPVIVGEQGNDENVWDYGSARRMRFRLWGALFNEISFVFWNTSYALNGHYMNIYLGPEERQYVRALQTFSSHLDAGMKMTPVERSTTQFRAYGLASDTRAAVYLHNRFGKSLKGESITLTVPKTGRGYWLAPDTLRLLGSFRIGAGVRKITLPDFRQDLALLISPDPVTGGTPTAIIDANPRFGIAPQEVVLDGRRSAGVFGRKIVSYQWSLGDGEKASGPTVTRTYPAGDYFVTLTVTDDAGATGSASLVVRAAKTMTTNRPPVVLATAEPTAGTAPHLVRFQGEAAALTGKIAGVSWDFGDGQTSDQLEVEHTYAQPGTYLATLTVRSDHDSAAQARFVITVE